MCTVPPAEGTSTLAMCAIPTAEKINLVMCTGSPAERTFILVMCTVPILVMSPAPIVERAFTLVMCTVPPAARGCIVCDVYCTACSEDMNCSDGDGIDC